MKGLGIHLSVQPEFLVRFRHAYLRQLGPEKASKLKPLRRLFDAGIPITFSSDRPIVSGDPWVGVRTAENRPDGFDPAENCTRLEALNAYCTTPKKWFPDLADTVQILDFDPLTSQ
jgi:predicted amidohydrolase YtcJ